MLNDHRGPRVASLATLLVASVVATICVTSVAFATSNANAKVSTVFAPATSFRSHSAVSYDPRAVPVGSKVEVVEKPNDLGGVIVELSVWGMLPQTKYDAYVYTRPCGATPASAGKRTQDGPSTQHYPQNEVWLNFSTSVHGVAHSSVDQYWRFASGQANSVALVSPSTRRVLACVTVPFK